MNKINNLPPFKHFCVTIGNLPSSYVDSLSYYELLMWFCNYLKNTVVPTVNNTVQAVTELQNYITHYFDNLDVQDEINNKLDSMVQSGELQEIISEYLNSTAIFGFNTISDMIVAENLIDGSYARTCGHNTFNDGYGALYKIRTITNDDVVDGENIIAMETSDTLIAERIRTVPNRKLVIIGDSYAAGYTPDGSISSWANYICLYLGLDYQDQYKGIMGGTGFATNTNNFNTLLQTISADPEVTDVVICGGYNDGQFEESDIITGIYNCSQTIKTRFPNAKVHIGMIGASNSGTSDETLKKVWKAYEVGCTSYNLHYLSNVEVVLRKPNTITSDNVHPNQTGQNLLGLYITQAIEYGSADVVYDDVIINNRIKVGLHNHDLTIDLSQGGFDCNIASLLCNGSTVASIITNKKSYFKKVSAIQLNTWVTAYDGTNNVNYCVPVSLMFDIDGIVYIAILKNNSDNTNFDTLNNISWIQMLRNSYKLEVMDC